MMQSNEYFSLWFRQRTIAGGSVQIFFSGLVVKCKKNETESIHNVKMAQYSWSVTSKDTKSLLYLQDFRQSGKAANTQYQK